MQAFGPCWRHGSVIAGLLEEALSHLPGRIEHGDLAVREEGDGGRLLPTAIFARWSR